MDTNSYTTHLCMFRPTAATAVTGLDILLADSDSIMFHQLQEDSSRRQES